MSQMHTGTMLNSMKIYSISKGDGIPSTITLKILPATRPPQKTASTIMPASRYLSEKAEYNQNNPRAI
jgi:hypothetical protein